MPRKPIMRGMLNKYGGNLRDYYMTEGDRATERAANTPGSYRDIPKSDIRSMKIADRLKRYPVRTATDTVKRRKKKKKKRVKTDGIHGAARKLANKTVNRLQQRRLRQEQSLNYE